MIAVNMSVDDYFRLHARRGSMEEDDSVPGLGDNQERFLEGRQDTW